MPNDLSDAFHDDLREVKQFFVKELAKIESGVETLLADLKAVLTRTVDEAGPVVIAAASAGVQAALSSTTGGLSALAAAGEAAALSVLKDQGVTLADEALQQMKTLVLGNVLKANSSPVSTLNGNQVTGG